MTLTLAQFRTRVLELLDDAGSVRYTSAQIDTALRSALKELTLAQPVTRTYQLDTTGYRVIDLPADFSADMITRLQLYDSSPNYMIDLAFQARSVDEQWSIETINVCYPAGRVLTVTYSTTHTIDTLDSAAGTTVTDDNTLALGAAGFAAQSRAISRAESINMQPQVTAQLLSLAKEYLTEFRTNIHKTRPYTAGMAAFEMPS